MGTCTEDRKAAFAGGTKRPALDKLLTPEFKQKFVRMCKTKEVDPYFLIQVIAVETGHTFSPKVCNDDPENPGASGLIQFYPNDGLPKLLFPRENITALEATERLRQMTAVQQLDYVAKFLDGISVTTRKNIRNAGELYSQIFYPAGWTQQDSKLQKVPGTVVLVADDTAATRRLGVPPESGRRHRGNVSAYIGNKGLDINNDGFITTADLLKVLENNTNYIPKDIFDGVEGYVNINTQRRAIVRSPASAQSGTSGTITPYIASYKSFHPNIQGELIRRKFSTDHVNTSMPFAKLTSLMFTQNEDTAERDRGGDDLGRNGWCPSIGLHGTPNARFEEIYRPYVNTEKLADYLDNKDKATLFKNASIVGESTVTGNERNPTLRRLNVVSRVTASIAEDPVNIPMPGITSINVERSTAGPMGVRGGLMKASIKITAYSVGQFDTLIKYFLRPGTPVVLEYGKISANNPTIDTFNWNQGSTNIQAQLWKATVVRSSEGMTSQAVVMPNTQELLNTYVYGNNGNYEILMGYTVKFTTKMNKDNIYEIELIVHSITQLEVPNVQTSALSTCANSTEKCKVYDMREYFNPKSSWKQNSYARLLAAYTSIDLIERGAAADAAQQYKRFVTYENDIVVVKSENSAGSEESTYFFTWRFFVEVVLGDDAFGILSMFPVQSLPLLLGSMLDLKSTNGIIKHDNDYLIANEVGYHPRLRSINPGTMIIVNKHAQSLEDANQLNEYEMLRQIYKINDKGVIDNSVDLPVTDIDVVLAAGSDFAPDTDKNIAGVSLLTKGIWINSNAVIDAFNKTDSLTQAIQALLTEMNNATQGYWNLQLLSSEDTNWPGLHVVDMGLSKRRAAEIQRLDPIKRDELLTSITQPLTNKKQILEQELSAAEDSDGIKTPKYIYVFNEKNRKLDDGDSIGSELIDLSIDFGIPTAIATQVIAGVGGTSQKPTLNLIDIDELNALKLMPGRGLLGICEDAKNTSQQPEDAPCNADPRASLEENLRRITSEQERRLQELSESKAGVTGSDLNKRVQEIVDEANAARDKAVQIAASGTNSEVVFGPMRSILSNFEALGTGLKYIELNPSNMMRKLNLDSRTDIDGEGNPVVPVAHAFNSSNLTKLLADLTLPGISGIQLFQSFLIDRTPSIIDNGYYIVTKVAHEITPDRGWITKIQGRFRYQPDTEGEKISQGLHARIPNTERPVN